jgi:hypothetical protein
MPVPSDAEILGRVVDPSAGTLEPSAAQGLLSLRFREQDVARMNELAARARDGSLSQEQRQEAESYNRIGHLLALLHSKARASLESATDGAGGR